MKMTRLYAEYFEADKRELAYSGEEEYREDLFAMLEVYLSAAVLMRVSAQGRGAEQWAEQLPLRGVALYVRKMWKLSSANRNSGVFSNGEALVAIKCAKSHIALRLSHTRMPLRYHALMEKMGFTEWEEFLFLLSFSVEYDEKYEMIFSYLQGDIRMPTLRFAVFLYELEKPLPAGERTAAVQKNRALYKYFLHIADTPEYNPVAYAVQLEGRVYAYLFGSDTLSGQMSEFAEAWFCTEPLEPACIREEEQRRIHSCLGELLRHPEQRGRVLCLSGEEGIGKKYLIRSAAAKLGKNLLFVHAGKLLAGTVPEIRTLLSRLMLESILLDAVICFTGYEPVPCENAGEFLENAPEGLPFLLSEIGREYSAVVWLGRERADFLFHAPVHVIYHELPMLTVGEREALWRAWLTGIPGGEDMDIRGLANQYTVTPRCLQEVLWDAKTHVQGGRGEITMQDIREAVQRQSGNRLGRQAVPVSAVYTWEDLVISDGQRHQLEMICGHARYRNIVGEDWGFYRRMPYGRGTCALFYGPPGTGKTMAVQVIANELGLRLYRIDLSQILSKYIGQTQKNIAELFRRAENTNTILFFDEADALFTRRSEVRDSHDRTANAETAYLLQRLEDYDGITVLATNHMGNIDEAFKRRIKFMVNFSFPAPEVRLKLWKTVLPEKALLEEELDFSFFAERFELSGSGIKEILVNAAFLAAAEGRGICNRDVEEAVRLHFAKYGRVLPEEEFAYRTRGGWQ